MHPELAKYADVKFQGDADSLYDRHLVFDYSIDPGNATPRERYEAVARSLRDVLALRWLESRKRHSAANAKRAYYLSMESLIGQSMAANITNMLADPDVLTES